MQETDENAKADDLDPEVYPEGTDCAEEDDISLGTGTASGGKMSVDIDTSSSDFVVGNEPYDKLGHKIWADWDGRSGSSLAAGTFRRGDRTMAAPMCPRTPSVAPTRSPSLTVPAGPPTCPPISDHADDYAGGRGRAAGRRVDHPRRGLVLRQEHGRHPGARITIGDEEAEEAFEVDVDDDGDGEFKIEVPNCRSSG